MFSFENLAPKLLINEITNAPVVETATGPKLTAHGIHYNRVQILGNLEGNSEQGYCVRDITGQIPVVKDPTAKTPIVFESKEQQQQPGQSNPVIVIGHVFESEITPEQEAAALEQGTAVPTPERFIEVNKLIKLGPESNISEQWMLEIDELARHVAYASSGDESWQFRKCVDTCQATGCASTNKLLENDQNRVNDTLTTQNLDRTDSVDYCSPLCSSGGGAKLNSPDKQSDAFWLALSSWDCSSDCSYRCMWLLEDTKQVATGAPVEKYFGKWPFIRVFGAQEPASVVFSILNLVANMVCFVKILGYNRKHTTTSTKNSARPSTRSATTLNTTSINTAGASMNNSTLKMYATLWMIHFVVSSNAWLWSSIFHFRDTRLTERFDYFSAGALVGYNLFLSLTRVAGVGKPTVFAGIGIPIAVMYSIHVHRMLNVLFDYGLHVGLCVAAGVIQTIVWLTWALGTKSGRSHPGKIYLLMFMASVNVAMLFEVLDFPPFWEFIDAHALWHAATAPLVVLWYRFVAADVALVLGNKHVVHKTKS